MVYLIFLIYTLELKDKHVRTFISSRGIALSGAIGSFAACKAIHVTFRQQILFLKTLKTALYKMPRNICVGEQCSELKFA